MNWWKIDELEKRIFEARENGHPITCDRYPYLAAMTELAAVFPEWLSEGGRARALCRLRNRATREQLCRHVERGATRREDWRAVQIAVTTPDTREFEGMNIEQAATHLGMRPAEAVIEILLRTCMSASAIYFEMSESNLRRILKWPFVYAGSDSSSRSLKGPTAEGLPHPRTFGTSARFLGEYVLRQKLMSLAEGIARMTSLPAERFGLKGRGVLIEGALADITIFDAAGLRDTATYEKPFSLSDGVRHVVVNGVPVLLTRRLLPARPGKVLRAR